MENNFIDELRNKLISDKFKEHFDETNISLVLYKLLDENEQLKKENFKLQARADRKTQIINKALKLINDNPIISDYEDNVYLILKIKKILKGSDNND